MNYALCQSISFMKSRCSNTTLAEYALSLRTIASLLRKTDMHC